MRCGRLHFGANIRLRICNLRRLGGLAPVIRDANDEHGWAATAGLRRPLTGWADLFFEAQHVQSTRPSRRLSRETPRQNQTVLQTAVRLKF
jgi:hypothetical protein